MKGMRMRGYIRGRRCSGNWVDSNEAATRAMRIESPCVTVNQTRLALSRCRFVSVYHHDCRVYLPAGMDLGIVLKNVGYHLLLCLSISRTQSFFSFDHRGGGRSAIVERG